MDAQQFERVVQLHVESHEEISKGVRDGINQAEDVINLDLIACKSDEVGGPLAVLRNEGVPTQDTWNAYVALIRRASRGSVALKVVEDCMGDDRFIGKEVHLTGYAELIDANVNDVIDHEGSRWKISPVVDQFRISNRRWKRIATVSPEDAEETTAGRVCMSLRAVAATIYAVLCGGEQGINPFFSLAVLLGKTSIAAASALDLTAAYPTGSYVEGEARLHLPCGSSLIVRVVNGGGERNVDEVVFVGGSESLSPLAKYAINIMACVLMGAGIPVTSEVDDPDEEHALPADIGRIIWMQAAVRCKVDEQGGGADIPVHELVRSLTIYGLATGIGRGKIGVDADRVLLAREEAKEIIGTLDGWDLEEFLDMSAFEIGSTASETESTNSDLTRFLHYGAGSSDLPLLERDVRSATGISICARRGIAIKPDTRRSIVIRKRKALWGRITFENNCFYCRPLVDPKAVLRAVIPFRSVSAMGIQLEQFEASMNTAEPGNEIANILLSGAYGADAALWALKKILYSGRGLNPGYVPPYLKPMKERLEDNGFAIVSVLGNVAVQCVEVVVDSVGRVILDYEGDFLPLLIESHGRRLRCMEIEEKDYVEGRVGTISASACI